MAGGGAFLAVYLISAVATIAYPFAVENGEGYVLHYAWLLASGSALYPDVHDPPWLLCNYPPLYPLLNAPFAWLWGVGFASGRAISLLAMLWVGAIVFDVARRESGRVGVGALLASCLFAIPHVAAVTVEYRVDMLASALSLTGVWVLWRCGERSWPLSAVCFVAALYTKHAMIAAPLAVWLWLLWRARCAGASGPARWRAPIGFVAMLVGVGMALFAAIDLWTDGGFHRHVVTYTSGEYSLPFAGLYFKTLLANTWPFAVGAAVALWLPARGGARDPWRVYAILATAATLSAGRRGASLLYLLETPPLFLILSARLAGWLLVREAEEENARLGGAMARTRRWGIVVALGLVVVFLATGVGEGLRPRSFRASGAYDRDRAIREVMLAVDGAILSEDFSYNLLAGRDVAFHPFAMSDLARRGLWDASDLVRRIRQREFSLIVLNSPASAPSPMTRDRFPESALEAVASNYPHRALIGGRFLYASEPTHLRSIGENYGK